MKLPNESTPGCRESIARVIWAMHILSYLTRKRRHVGLYEPDAAAEEGEGPEYGNLDAETERTVVLQGSRKSIRSKFLDCTAQLMSPSKGWENVTATALREYEDFVEIDIARNDCFGMTGNSQPGQSICNLGEAEVDYFRELKIYLSTGTQQALSSDFELTAIAYTGRRVDYWVGQLRALLASPDLQGWNNKPWYKRLLKTDIWSNLVELLYREDIEATTFREQIVQYAYECVVSKEVARLIQMAVNINDEPKLWDALNLVARPIIDCRMLKCIASQYPQFRKAKFFQVPPRPKTGISLEFQIDISKAWARLNSATPSSSELRTVAEFGEQFKKDCAASYSLHAEIQLFMHYEDTPKLTPSLPYFGCSKKACLLCEVFLRALPSQIVTRGSHGICYSAWGVPPSRSVGAETALKSLENMLVSRIKTFLGSPIQARKTYFAPPIPQSALVSDFSASTTQDFLNRETRVTHAKEVEDALRIERLTLEGAAVTPQPTDRSHPMFEPHDSCVMCNQYPAKQCKQCHSSWYCSRKCQKSDWPTHKLLCRNAAIQSSRPSPSHKRAIFFPVSCDKPRMIWLPCEREVEDGIPYEVVNPYPYLGVDRPTEGTMRIEHNPVRNRNLGSGMVYWAPRKEGYSIAVIFREAFLKDGSAINSSILKSVSTSGITPHQWCGPMVAIRETPSEFHEDITLADFRHIIDYLISYGTTEARESASHLQDRTSTKIRGVKICCYGEEKLHGSDPYVLVDVSRAHPTRLTLSRGTISPISKLLGMPLKLWKYPDIETWIDPPGWDENITAESNQNAAFLMMETDPEKPEWGWVPLYWDMELGNVLAVRADDKDLTVDDVRMMCNFTKRKLQPMFEDALGNGLVRRTKQEVLDFITRENMVRWAK